MTFDSEADLGGAVARLFVYPVKSCAGVEVQEAVLTEAGLEYDRAWMLVDDQLPLPDPAQPAAHGAGAPAH
jgi:uncharacterized protein YcbX